MKKIARYLYTSKIFFHAALHGVLIIFRTEYIVIYNKKKIARDLHKGSKERNDEEKGEGKRRKGREGKKKEGEEEGKEKNEEKGRNASPFTSLFPFPYPLLLIFFPTF